MKTRRKKLHRTTRTYKKRHAELIEKLGGKCVECAATDRLEVDHVDGRDWKPREHSSTARVARYWREYESGILLRVLCKSCNCKKENKPGSGDPVPPAPVDADAEPAF